MGSFTQNKFVHSNSSKDNVARYNVGKGICYANNTKNESDSCSWEMYRPAYN